MYTITDRSIETLGLLTVSGAKAVLENECRPREEGRWTSCMALQMSVKAGRLDVAQQD